MQGKRSAIGSLADSINFDYGSTSSNVGIDQQICWNIGESSSSNLQNPINHDERMTQSGWSSSITSVGASLRVEGQQNEPSGVTPRNGVNLNLNMNQVASYDLMDCSNSSEPDGLEHRLIPSSSGSSEPFASSSGSVGFPVEEDDGRSVCTLDSRRLSCKRKTIEGNVGQSSSSMWQAVPPCYTAGTGSLNISPQLETSLGINAPDSVNSRLELSMAGAGVESLQRNNRVRMNPLTQQDSLPNNSFVPQVPVGHQPPRSVLVNSLTDSDNANPHGRPVVLRLPGLERNIQRGRWSGASWSRTGSLSASLAPRERDAPGRGDSNPRPVPRNISEHPMVIPPVEARSNSAHNPANWSLNGGALGIPRHAGSGSQAGSRSGSHSASGPTWGSSRRHLPSQYSRRLSEYVRRSLLTSAGSEIGSRPVASSSQEVVLPSGGGSQGNNQQLSRSAQWMDRNGDGVIGIPYSLHALSAAGEGRGRLVSEHIRNVLDIMRRGEGLRFEDAMILDPSVFFGMADIHDLHRDMRLDVDNMSYEELLALEERIGNVCTGLSVETIAARMKQRKYSSFTRDDQAEEEPCCICQEEYNDGENLGTLDCGHDFHSECIKQWLAQKNLCPICKTTALST